MILNSQKGKNVFGTISWISDKSTLVTVDPSSTLMQQNWLKARLGTRLGLNQP